MLNNGVFSFILKYFLNHLLNFERSSTLFLKILSDSTVIRVELLRMNLSSLWKEILGWLPPQMFSIVLDNFLRFLFFLPVRYRWLYYLHCLWFTIGTKARSRSMVMWLDQSLFVSMDHNVGHCSVELLVSTMRYFGNNRFLYAIVLTWWKYIFGIW